jgi:hypothetical protein
MRVQLHTIIRFPPCGRATRRLGRRQVEEYHARLLGFEQGQYLWADGDGPAGGPREFGYSP